MKRGFVTGFLFLLALQGLPQSNLWYITRGGLGIGTGGGDEAWGVDVDTSGNIYWATCEKPVNGAFYNIILYKISDSGQQIYSTPPYGGSWNEKAFVVKVKSPDVFVAGRADASLLPVSSDALVISYAMMNGVFQWDYTWDGGVGYEEIDGVVADPSGIFLSGWTTDLNTSNDFLIQKIDYNGQQLWNNPWGTTYFDDANGHMVADGAYLYIAGRDSAAGQLSNDGNAIMTCFDKNNGSLVWRESWGGFGIDDYFGLAASADSFLYGVGFTTGFGNGSQIFVNKYSRSGDLQWSRIWGGTGSEASRAIVCDGDSIIYVAGKTTSYGNGGDDIFILKYDSSGALIDSLFWGGFGYEVAHDIAFHNGYLYITGETGSFGTINTQYDALLLKVNGRLMLAPDTITALPAVLAPESFTVSVSPNPLSNQTMIHFSRALKNASLKLRDLAGRNMISIDGYNDNSIKLNLPYLHQGIYLLEIIENNTSISIVRLIVID